MPKKASMKPSAKKSVKKPVKKVTKLSTKKQTKKPTRKTTRQPRKSVSTPQVKDVVVSPVVDPSGVVIVSPVVPDVLNS